MKKTIFATVLLSIFATVFISCGSTKEIQSTPDTYTSDENITAPVIEESDEIETIGHLHQPLRKRRVV